MASILKANETMKRHACASRDFSNERESTTKVLVIHNIRPACQFRCACHAVRCKYISNCFYGAHEDIYLHNYRIIHMSKRKIRLLK